MQIPYSSSHPAAAALRELFDRDARQQSATDATNQSDFLRPNWEGVKSYSVMHALNAVALSCGINPRHAWAIPLADGEDTAREAIQEARDRLRFIKTCGVAEGADVALLRIAEWAEEHGWRLPAEFPSKSAHLLPTDSNVSPKRSQQSPMERQAYRYQFCIDMGLKMPKTSHGRFPRGIGDAAKRLRITRQSLVADLKAHIDRLSQS